MDLNQIEYHCQHCGTALDFDPHEFRFTHRVPGPEHQPLAALTLNMPAPVIVGEVVEVRDEYALARPFTASAQIDPKPYGGPWLR